MAKTFLVMKCEVLRVQKSAAENVLGFLIFEPWLDRVLIRECESRRV